jgi:hypothetical protein
MYAYNVFFEKFQSLGSFMNVYNEIFLAPIQYPGSNFLPLLSVGDIIFSDYSVCVK